MTRFDAVIPLVQALLMALLLVPEVLFGVLHAVFYGDSGRGISIRTALRTPQRPPPTAVAVASQFVPTGQQEIL